MKVLVFGQTGQVARELARFDEVTTLSRADADLTNPAACAAIIAETDADAIINAAAYTNVDGAEDDADTALRVNGDAPKAMAEAAAARGIPFVHISTDYVFDGTGTAPWSPEQPTGPLGVYGATKLAGEDGVRGAGGTFAILRTAWVFSAHGKNFLKTMLKIAQEHTERGIVADQFGGPTPARDIAAACMTIARALVADASKSGTYHFSGAPDVNWADFARGIFEVADLGVTVHDIPASTFPTKAKRPENSRLDCTTTFETFGLNRPDWKAGIAPILADLRRSNEDNT